VKAEFDNYVRLAKSLFGMSSLWMGDDHLVYVRGTGFLMPFAEDYKRYRYPDIQLLVVARTSRWMKSLLYLLGLLFFGAPAAAMLLVPEGAPGPVVAGFASILVLGALVFLALLLRHLILGPSCVCEIQTGLSRDRIRSLTRYHQALETIDRIEGRIRESQAKLRDSGEGVAGQSTQPARVPEAVGFSVPQPVIPTLAAFLAFGLLCIGALHLQQMWLTGLALVSVAVISFLLTFSLVVVVRRATPESVRSSLWALLGMLFLLVGSAAVYYLWVAVEEPSYTVGLTGPLEAFTGVVAETGMVGYFVFLGLSAGLFVAALVGLINAIRWRRHVASRPEAAAGAGETEGGASHG